MSKFPTFFPCDIAISPDGSEVRRFSTRQEVVDYAHGLKGYWSNRMHDNPMHNEGHMASSAMDSVLKGFEEVTDINRTGDADFIRTGWNIFTHTHVIIPDSRRGQLVQNLLDTYKEAAVICMVYLQKRPLEPTSHAQIYGAVAAALMEAGNIDMKPSRQKVLDGMIESSRSRLDEIIRFAENHASTNAPMMYWSAKAKALNKVVYRLRNWLAIGFFASVILFVALIGWLSYETKASGAIDQMFYLRLVSIGLAATGTFWIMRFLGRLFMSYTHLASDASERATMIQTYRALIKYHPDEIGDKDRIHVLQAIFRSASTGLVSSDAVPNQTIGINVDKIIKGE